MLAKSTIGLTLIVVALLVGGLVLYFHPAGSPPTSLATVPQPSGSSLTSPTAVTQFASIENCTYTATSSFVSNIGGGVLESGATKTTVSYVTTTNSSMPTGAMVTTTTRPIAANEQITGGSANGITTVTIEGNTGYLGEPYTVSCTYVK